MAIAVFQGDETALCLVRVQDRPFGFQCSIDIVDLGYEWSFKLVEGTALQIFGYVTGVPAGPLPIPLAHIEIALDNQFAVGIPYFHRPVVDIIPFIIEGRFSFNFYFAV